MTHSSRREVSESVPRTTAELVLAKLKDEILTGKLPPGTKLNERQLTERYEVSRTPLREALQLLVRSQLAVNIPYRGVFVQKVSFGFARNIYEVRAGLEGLAGALAAERASRLDVARLSDLYEKIEELTPLALKNQSARDEIMRLNTQFHRVIAASTRNPVLATKIEELWISVNLVRFTVWQTDNRIDSSLQEHRAILEAVKARDSELARALCYSHSLKAWEHVANVLKSQENSRGE